MNKSTFNIFGFSLAGLLLAGCAGPGVEEAPLAASEIAGKVLSPASITFGDEGDPCIADSEIFLSFPGSQVTLKNSQGDIIGLTTVEINEESVNPGSAGANEGSNCAFPFTFTDVVVEDEFYSIEFGVSQLTPVTVSREDLLSGVVVTY